MSEKIPGFVAVKAKTNRQGRKNSLQLFSYVH